MGAFYPYGYRLTRMIAIADQFNFFLEYGSVILGVGPGIRIRLSAATAASACPSFAKKKPPSRKPGGAIIRVHLPFHSSERIIFNRKNLTMWPCI
jgi:hypothetical protein